MGKSPNPFNSLYRTESISASAFVQLFSTVLVRESLIQRIFEPGNVILCGLQGSGKSALLNLLKPDILLAFHESNRRWPIPDHCSRFISASVTLRSSGALLFGQRSIGTSNADSETLNGLYFGDFLNYWIILDLVRKIRSMFDRRSAPLANKLGLNPDPALLDLFAVRLCEHSCWIGAMKGIKTFDELEERLHGRVLGYESFLNYNSDFPAEMATTKTTAGEPIAVASDCLRSSGIIGEDTPLFVTIDQFEDLMDIERDMSDFARPVFRAVIMKMLGKRDDRVSYRIGARLYSLDKGVEGLSGNASVEDMREISVVNIDEILQGRENRKSLFPEFCDDVLWRRLMDAGYPAESRPKSTVKYVFGGRVTPEEKARRFISKGRQSLIKSDAEIEIAIAQTLKEIALKDPLSAKLGEAWVLQQMPKGPITAADVSEEPWSRRQWWKKERKQQALLQVFSQSNQRLVWYGAGDVVSLSGRNILTFLSICQFTWAEVLREGEPGPLQLPHDIDPSIQTMALNSASEHWFRKIKAEPKGGDDRNRFANVLGSTFRDRLRADRKMSYPGQNGFSLPINTVDDEPAVEKFLSDCVAFGVLESRPHTPKSKSRGQSEKWYLSPILSPHFQIPYAHIKEPYYASVSEVKEWMLKAKVHVDFDEVKRRQQRKRAKQADEHSQLDLNFRS